MAHNTSVFIISKIPPGPSSGRQVRPHRHFTLHFHCVTGKEAVAEAARQMEVAEAVLGSDAPEGSLDLNLEFAAPSPRSSAPSSPRRLTWPV